eukprot:scaffold79193_cov63-Phaeocystis_antarctica.AAC.7
MSRATRLAACTVPRHAGPNPGTTVYNGLRPYYYLPEPSHTRAPANPGRRLTTRPQLPQFHRLPARALHARRSRPVGRRAC